jgi:hypothetical protein
MNRRAKHAPPNEKEQNEQEKAVSIPIVRMRDTPPAPEPVDKPQEHEDPEDQTECHGGYSQLMRSITVGPV